MAAFFFDDEVEHAEAPASTTAITSMVARRMAVRRRVRRSGFPYHSAMFEWSEELQMMRDAVRQFVDNEVRPHREELEHGDLPPYDLLRKLYTTFGMGQTARGSFRRRIDAEKAASGSERDQQGRGAASGSERDQPRGGGAGMT